MRGYGMMSPLVSWHLTKPALGPLLLQDVIKILRKRAMPVIPSGSEVWLWGLGRHMGTQCAWSLRFSPSGAFREEIRCVSAHRVRDPLAFCPVVRSQRIVVLPLLDATS